MTGLGKYFLWTILVLTLMAAWGTPVSAGGTRTVAGVILEVYNDEVAGEALVSLNTNQGLFIIDCRRQSFPQPIAPGDRVKVTVDNVRTVKKKTVGDLVAVLEHTPARR